jgi:hypothetical protein
MMKRIEAILTSIRQVLNLSDFESYSPDSCLNYIDQPSIKMAKLEEFLGVKRSAVEARLKGGIDHDTA